MVAGVRLASLAATWLRDDERQFDRRWREHLHQAALRYFLYDNTVAGERYLSLNALVLDPSLQTSLATATEVLAGVFRKAAHTVRQDRQQLERMGFNWAVAEMLRQEHPLPLLSPIGRFDFLLDSHNEWRLLEYNSDTPSGLRETVGAAHLLRATLGPRARWRRPSAVLGRRLVAAFRRLLAAAARPVRRLGLITDAGYAEDLAQVLFLREVLASLPVECIVGDIHNLAVRSGRVTLLGHTVGALYRLYPIERLYGEAIFPDLLSAALDGRIHLLNPLVALLAQDKALLAWIWANRRAPLYSEAESHAIMRHIPATWYIDALPDGFDRRGSVIKEFFGREGEEVYFGADISDADWARCREWRTFVVQERVHSATAEWLPSVGNRWQPASGVPCVGSYVANERWAGLYVRIGDPITTNRAQHVPALVGRLSTDEHRRAPQERRARYSRLNELPHE